MPEMELIVAVDRSGGIGKDGQLLYSIPEDLKRFKQITMGKTLLMGRATFESLPGKRPLPGRINCVLSRRAAEMQVNYPAGEFGPFFFSSLEEFLSAHPENGTMIIGGGEVYSLCLPFCTRAHVTKINDTADADTFFSLNEDWRCVAREPGESGDGLYEFLTYARISG